MQGDCVSRRLARDHPAARDRFAAVLRSWRRIYVTGGNALRKIKRALKEAAIAAHFVSAN
jgi:hypothetical protein